MMAPFNVTPAAHTFLRGALSKSNQGTAIGIRIGVKKAGCSGYEYVLEYIYDEVGDLDFVFDYDQFKIVVDKEIYLKYFKGATLDYRVEGLNEGLKFDNPNVASKCGCGESFNLRDDVKDV